MDGIFELGGWIFVGILEFLLGRNDKPAPKSAPEKSVHAQKNWFAPPPRK